MATMEGEPLRDKTYNHVVFKMAVEDYDNKLQRIQALGLDVREGRSRVDGEGARSTSTILTTICSNCTAGLCKTACVVMIKPEKNHARQLYQISNLALKAVI